MKGSQATIKDIARQLNISVATVSRALRNLPDVSPQTRKSVLDIAQKLDYQPNSIALSLLKKKTNVVGIVVPDIAVPFFASAISGIQEVLFKSGYHLMICQSNECYQTEITNVQALLASRVEGLIMSLSKETIDHEIFRSLFKKGTPIVFFDRVCEDIDTYKVVVDDYQGAFMAVEHLISVGCRRIAHLAGQPTLSISRNRLNGYLDALKKHNLPIDPELIMYSGFIKENVIVATRQLVNMPCRPDGIFMVTDPVAIQAMVVIKEIGLRIPEDIAVVGFGNEIFTSIFEPSLTTVAQYPNEMGKAAAQLFLNQLKNFSNKHTFAPTTQVIKTKLIIRNSTARKQP